MVIFLERLEKITVGKLGSRVFWTGHYLYTGSAAGNGATSLPNRLSRHLRRAKKKHWHIDFLLGSRNAHVLGIAAAAGQHGSECQVNQLLRHRMKATEPLIPRFGATDCRNRCGSHLLYFGDRSIMKKIQKVYHEKFGETAVFLESDDFPNGLDRRHE